MDCPKCKSKRYVKAGFVKDRQRFKCRECHYLYTVSEKSTTKPVTMKRFALHLYLEGLGFRSIGRLLGVSNVCVLKWIRAFGEQVASIRTGERINVVEIDELHTYIGKKTLLDYFNSINLPFFNEDSSDNFSFVFDYKNPLLFIDTQGIKAFDSKMTDKFPDKVKNLRGYEEDKGHLFNEAYFAGTDFASSLVPPLDLIRSIIKGYDLLAEKGIGLIHTTEGIGFPKDLDITQLEEVMKTVQESYNQILPQR